MTKPIKKQLSDKQIQAMMVKDLKEQSEPKSKLEEHCSCRFN